MKLTSASTYAVTALAYLAREQPAGPVTAHVIAVAEGIPEKFLLKLLTPLAHAGLVLSRRGPGGGYALARDPKGVTLLEIIDAVDGLLRGVVRPVGKEGAALDKRLQAVCNAAAALVRERLKQVTLAELARRADG
jgi:Rrf2 family protein